MTSKNFWLFLFLSCASVTDILGDIILRPSCNSGWFYYKSYCYGYFRNPLKWSDAELECQTFGNGAHLASIQDLKEAKVLAKHIRNYQQNQPVWIGLHDPQKNNKWKWIDGALYFFRSWSDISSPGNKACAEITYTTNFVTWNKSDCNKAQHFVCKYRP